MKCTRWTVAALLFVAGCAWDRDVVFTGETVKVRSSEKPPASAIFDGERLRLRGARGETLGVQVFVRSPTEVSLEVDGKGLEVAAFEVGYVSVREPSTAMYGPSRGSGRYPDILRPVFGAVHAERHAYFDVVIGRDAEPGRHAGKVRVGGRTYPVELDVEPITIDLDKAPLVWVFYHPDEIARTHGVSSDSPEHLRVEARYHELFRRHGTYLASGLGPHRFPPRRQFVRDVSYWPVAVDTSSDERLAADVAAWLGYFDGMNVTPFVIPVDEPHTLGEKTRARRIAEAIGRAGGGRPRLLRGVTDAAGDVYGEAIDVYVSPENIPRAAGIRRRRGEHFWTYNGRPPQAGSMIIDTDGVALRTWGWLAFRYGVELWYAWEGLYFSDRYNRGGPTDLMTDPVSFDERSRGGEDYGNGDGVLAYPGALPSLRLKALRRGLEDRLLLVRLRECSPKDADAIARELVPRGLGEANGRPSWPRDERRWEEGRGRIFDAIERSCARAA